MMGFPDVDSPRVGPGQGQPIFSGPDPDPGRPSHPPAGPDLGSAGPGPTGSGQGRQTKKLKYIL